MSQGLAYGKESVCLCQMSEADFLNIIIYMEKKKKNRYYPNFEVIMFSDISQWYFILLAQAEFKVARLLCVRQIGVRAGTWSVEG